MNSFFALVASTLLAAPSFTASTLDGRAVTGELASLDREKLVLRTAEGETAIPRPQLLAIESTGEQEVQPLPIAVELLGDSTLRAESYEVQGETAHLKQSGDRSLELPARQVRSVQLTELDAETTQRFDELVAGNAAADTIAVRKKESDSTTFLEGVVGDVTADTVRFQLDGDEIPVKRNRIQGIIYYRGKQPAGTEPAAVVSSLAGDRLAAVELRLEGDELVTKAASGAEIRQPLSAISKIDFSAGKIQYLADLKPESFRWTPYFGAEELPAPLVAFHALRRDRGWSTPAMRLDGKSYSRGIALTSRSEVVYRVPSGGRRFQTVVGIDDGVGNRGHAILRIFGDEKRLFEEAISGQDKPREIDLDVAAVRRLRIEVDYGADADVADHLNLCDARISR